MLEFVGEFFWTLEICQKIVEKMQEFVENFLKISHQKPVSELDKGLYIRTLYQSLKQATKTKQVIFNNIEILIIYHQQNKQSNY